VTPLVAICIYLVVGLLLLGVEILAFPEARETILQAKTRGIHPLLIVSAIALGWPALLVIAIIKVLKDGKIE